MKVRVQGWMDGWMNEWMNEWINNSLKEGNNMKYNVGAAQTAIFNIEWTENVLKTAALELR